MSRIDIKGDIVVNEYQEFYDWFGWECTCPKSVQEIIDATPENETIDVYINSPGGHVTAGQEIYSLLRQDKRTRIHIQGMACSSASIIAMAGHSDMSPVAMLMVHNVSGGASGDFHEMEKAQRELKSMNEALAGAYADKTGMDMQKLLQLMDRETWLTANQCVELGFVDEIDKPAQANMYVNAYESGLKMTDEMLAKAKSEMKKAKENEDLAKSIIEDLDLYGV